jgi:hypothetical protein
MSRPQRIGPPLKDIAIVPLSRNEEPTKHGVPPKFDGTIASACESVGISVEHMIEMMRWAKERDPRIAQFLDTWDALDPSERQDMGMIDAVREQVGLAPVDLLRIVANVACRIAMYEAQIIAAVSHPFVVGKTVERAMTDEGIADRIALHKATGFLPMPKGSRTIISVMQNAQAPAAAESVAAPRPEQTIRRMSDRFNEVRAVPPIAREAFPPEGDK